MTQISVTIINLSNKTGPMLKNLCNLHNVFPVISRGEQCFQVYGNSISYHKNENEIH